MGFDQVLVLVVLVLAFIALALDLWTPDAVLLGALAIVVSGGVISLEKALSGFGNTTLLALGSLYVVAAAMRDSGALDKASSVILGRRKQSIHKLLWRMCPSVSVYSAFLNNTPIVAMGIPAIRRWSRRHNLSPSKLLMPLSFAAILGGICTLIGTSTNLITHGLLQSHGYKGLTFFELAWIGLPCAVVGMLYIVYMSPYLTPDRVDIRNEEEEERSMLVELEISEDAPIVGQTVEDAGLNSFPGFYLARINRNDHEIAPVSGDEELRAGDHLLYASEEGDEFRERDLEEYKGLRLAFQPPRDITVEEDEERELHQLVVREGSSLIGSTVEDTRLLDRFGAAVTGVRREGERINNPLSQIELKAGDVLLLDTKRNFRQTHEYEEDFYVTSETGGEVTDDTGKKEIVRKAGKDLYITVAVLIGIITSVVAGYLHIALAGTLGVMVLLATDVIDPGKARQSVDWTVLIVIGAALGLGKAMEVSGLAQMVGQGIVDITKQFGPRVVLAGIVIITTLFTQIITNNGAIAIMFPITLSTAQSLGLNPRAFLIAITVAASLSLITPIGYQTNLMVYGPGNYRFTDFTKVGMPLQVMLWIMIILFTPLIWPL